MKFYDDMFDQIPRKRMLWPRNQRETHCLHRWPHIWNSRTSGASRHPNTMELPLKQKQNLHQIGDPIKRHTDLFKYGYIILLCRTHHFRWKGQCATEIQFLNTPHDRLRCRQVMTQFDYHALLPAKKLTRVLSRPRVGATAILATEITWCHGNTDYNCSQFKHQFAFNVIIGINHG